MKPRVYQSTIHQLKTGSEVLIRTLRQEEAQALVDLKRGYIKDTTSLPIYLHEYPDDAIKEAVVIKEYNESPNGILLVAENDGKLIGNIDLTGSPREKMQHTAMLGMGINEEWRNQGLGGLLIDCAIEWAKHQSKLEIIWLDVYSTNLAGQKLYKNKDFEECGLIRQFFKEESSYADKIQMYRSLV